MGVTPGSTHVWNLQTDYNYNHHTMIYSIYCFTHNSHQIATWEKDAVSEDDKVGTTIGYSLEINNMTPTIYDY